MWSVPTTRQDYHHWIDPADSAAHVTLGGSSVAHFPRSLRQPQRPLHSRSHAVAGYLSSRHAASVRWSLCGRWRHQPSSAGPTSHHSQRLLPATRPTRPMEKLQCAAVCNALVSTAVRLKFAGLCDALGATSHLPHVCQTLRPGQCNDILFVRAPDRAALADARSMRSRLCRTACYHAYPSHSADKAHG